MNHEKKEYCMCDGAGTCTGCTLFMCKNCGAAEGTLPTHCPGVFLTGKQEDDIYKGKLDFKEGQGIILTEEIDYLDEDGYPTDEALDKIKNWEIKDFSELEKIFDFVGDLWSYPEYWRVKTSLTNWETGQGLKQYTISTGGWSGNESLIGAMQDNPILWGMTWISSRRGGHYEFEVKI